MPKPIPLLCAVCCVAGCLAIPAAKGASPADLLTNGGFEEGTTAWNPDPRHELVKDKVAAHTGEACLTGTLAGPNQALRLRRLVPVKAGNRYELILWARATKRTKLVVFTTQPGSPVRESAAQYPGVPAKWTRYTTPLAVQADGMLGLEIIAPSSHKAPAGQIWIDDIAMIETPMPPVRSVSQGVGFNDEPSAARAADGSIYVAYNSFRDGADSLQVARYQIQGNTFTRLGAWQLLGGKGACVLGPRVVAHGEGVAVVYAAEQANRCWDIYRALCGPEGPGQPVAITSDKQADTDPAAAAQQGVLWLAWESSRAGTRQILVASLAGGDVAEPVAVSPPDASSYDPSVAILPGGEVCVAWHSFRDNNYDVYLARKSPHGDWGRPLRLTHAPAVDRHAMLFARGEELWIAYEHAQTERYNVTRTNRRRLFVAQVSPEGKLLAPQEGPGVSPLAGRCEAAHAAFDSSGRLWLAMLRPRLPRAGWDTYLTCYADGDWLVPMPVSHQKGMDRRPGLVLVDDRPVVAFQTDDAPQSWSDLDTMARAASDIHLAAVDRAGLPADSTMQLEPLVEPDAPFEAAELRVQRGEDTPTPTIDYQGQKLQLYFGDLHEHSDVSVCNRVGDQSVDESYQHMRDVARHDFACVTDHGYNINPYLWGYLAKQARVNDDPQRFLTFLGEEWTSTFEEYSEAHPYGFYGHRNLIFANPYFPKWFNARNRQTPAQVWEELRRMNANFIHIPHQLADTGNVPTDWNFHDEQAQPAAEIFQTRGSYEYKGTPREAPRSTPRPGYFIQDAWARGIVIGVIASPDHGGGYGKACVFAPELTREAILDAIRARHCYGTTAAKIFLDVRVDGHLMGEKIAGAAGDTVEVKIAARCPQPIDRVEICRNNQFIYASEPEGNAAALTFVDHDPLPGRSYYYVRVIQEDEEIAWSSPVWFGAK